MDTNYNMLKKLLEDFKPKEQCILSGKEKSKIENTLCLEQMDLIQLHNIRDFTVTFIAGKIRDEQNVKNTIDQMDILSGITAVIDEKIYTLGGEI